MVIREREDDLSLFRELGSRENERNDLNLLQNSEEFDAPCGSNRGSAPIFNLSSSGLLKKKHIDDFLSMENDKSDYDWLLTPPDMPLFPTLEKEPQKTVKSQAGIPRTCQTTLNSRNSAGSPTSNASSAISANPSLSGGLKITAGRLPAPTGRPTIPTKTKINKPLRPSTPTSRATLASIKPTTASVRSSTPTRSAPRSLTPTTRLSLPASKSASRSSTPNQRPTASSTASSVSAPPKRSSSATRSASIAAKNPAQSRGTSPTVRSRPRKPSEMPGFLNDAPTKPRTVLPDRPDSASRGRPEASRNTTVQAACNGRQRQQSCSPSRGRNPVGGCNNRSSVPATGKARSISNDDVNPVLMGTKMVERVINMRRLPPPKLDSPVSNNASRRSSSIDNAGFGRTLSKKSLDMAMRHMDIKRSIQGNLRPLRSGGSTKSKSISVSDSTLATSSNASSEPSVSNNSHCLSGSDLEDNGCSLERIPFVSIACDIGGSG